MPWRNVTPASQATPPALSTPLVWAGGGALLMLSLWLTGIIAIFRAVARLFG